MCHVTVYKHPPMRLTVYILSPLLWSWFLHNVFCTYVQCNIKTTLLRTQKTLNCKYTNLMAYKVLHLLLFYEVIYFPFIVRKQVASVFKDTKHLHTPPHLQNFLSLCERDRRERCPYEWLHYHKVGTVCSY